VEASLLERVNRFAVLVRLDGNGARAHAVFFVQRADARVFQPNSLTDPEFAALATRAARTGVGFDAWRLHLDRRWTRLDGAIPVEI